MGKKEDEKSVSFPKEKKLDEHQKMILMKDYEPPRTKKTGVETESGFCGSIVDDNPDTSEKNISIEAQEIGIITDYDRGTVTGGDGGVSVSPGWDY